MHPVDFLWFSQNRDESVDEMAGQLEQTTSRILGEFLAQSGRSFLAYVAVDFGDLAEPTFFDGFEEELEGRIVPQHVAHLNCESALVSFAMHLAAGSQLLSCRFVEMDVFPGFEAPEGCGDELVDVGFYGNKFDFGIVEDLVFVEPLGCLVGPATGDSFALLGIFFANPNDFIEIGKVEHGGKLSFGMRMPGADLRGFDSRGIRSLGLHLSRNQGGS